jgi:hypothetical protein
MTKDMNDKFANRITRDLFKNMISEYDDKIKFCVESNKDMSERN